MAQTLDELLTSLAEAHRFEFGKEIDWSSVNAILSVEYHNRLCQMVENRLFHKQGADLLKLATKATERWADSLPKLPTECLPPKIGAPNEGLGVPGTQKEDSREAPPTDNAAGANKKRGRPPLRLADKMP